MATQKDIERTIGSQLESYLTAYPIDVAYPNVVYDPVVGTPYLKIDYLHAETSQVELGTESDDRAVGVFQITVNVRNNYGSSQAYNIIAQLKEYFKRGITISYNGLNVRITQFYLGSYSSDGDYYREVINIVFRSDLSN